MKKQLEQCQPNAKQCVSISAFQLRLIMHDSIIEMKK